MDESRRVERRTLLKRSSIAIGALLGVGFAGARVSTPQTPAGAPLTLQGVHWRLTYPARARGIIPQAGERSSVFGELLAGPEQEKVGEFYATSTQFGSPFGTGAFAADALETHHFTLADGTLIGIGTLSDLYGAPSTHAIIGGTGRYEGATGSYVARQRPIELGGDGTADFEFHIITRSA